MPCAPIEACLRSDAHSLPRSSTIIAAERFGQGFLRIFSSSATMDAIESERAHVLNEAT